MTHSSKPKNSEVDAYTYIKEELEKLGWIVKNPARVSDWEVYKQNEVLYHNELKKCLDRDMPEAVVKLNDIEFWVIESKRDRDMINQALDEAKNQYAKKINESSKIKCVLISWVAGNDTDWYIVRNKYLKNGKWEDVLLEEWKIKNILLSKSQAQYILENDKPEWQEFPDLPEEKYIDSALEINEILHNAWINKNKRARFIAWLVLAMSGNSKIDLRENDTTTLVNSVNNLIEKKLRDVYKENFFNFLKLELPPSRENHIKYRNAIKESIKELEALDIKNAMASWKDILWEFYEKFLKYGNWAKEIWIVLTPRHITEFAVEVLDVSYNDFVFDPTCWTWGFLVSSFDHIKKTANDEQIDKFKQHNLFGIEQDDEVVALALVNMIFRWDGRNNMSEWNCFQKNIEQTIKDWNQTWEFKKRVANEITKKPVITKVLMNPPFALKKWDEKERHFINHALSQMQDWWTLFALIPISVMVEWWWWKDWRKELLENNSLLSIVTFPDDLFYPVSVWTVWVFLRKWIPHNFENQNVYFARCITDGFRKKKWKRITDKKERNQIKEIKEELKAFLVNQNLNFENVPEFKKICKLDKEDKNYELVPESYIDSKIPTQKEIDYEIDQMIRDSVWFLIKNHKI